MQEKKPEYCITALKSLHGVQRQFEQVIKSLPGKTNDHGSLQGGFHQLLKTVQDFVESCIKLVEKHLQQLRETSEARLKLSRIQEYLSKLIHKWDSLQQSTKSQMQSILQESRRTSAALKQIKDELIFADQVIISCDSQKIWQTLREATRIQIAGLDSMFELELPRSPYQTQVAFQAPQHDFIVQPIQRTSYFLIYNLRKCTATVQELTDGRVFTDQFGVAQAKTQALVAGGRGPKSTTSRTTYSISKDGQNVMVRADMLTPRACFPLAALKERFVFATGGFNNDWLRECERYDFKSDSWKPLPPLLRKRFFHASSSYRDQYVYVYCGYAGFGNYLNTIQRYTLSHAKWTLVNIYNPSPFWKRRSQIRCLQTQDNSVFIFGQWLHNHASFRLSHGAGQSLMISQVHWTKQAPGTGGQYGACLWEGKTYSTMRQNSGIGLMFLEDGKWSDWGGSLPGNIGLIEKAVNLRDGGNDDDYDKDKIE